MSSLISNANGNLTGAATFAAAEIGAGALQPVRFNHNSSFAAAASGTSPAFTVTSGKVIDGVLLWVKQDGSVVSNGTFKVDLQKGAVSQASVTVNKTDLPPNTGGGSTNSNSPIFFKFTGTATGDGAANWTLVITTTGTAGVVYASLRQNVASDFTRIFRTTTAQTPVAGDDLYITGELTGAGTHNSFTVTMNSTAATVYGNGTVNSTTVAGGLIAVSGYGTLSYGVAASTNYILRINGDLRVHAFGTLNIGSAGAEIPRTSTAVLELQPVSASGDFGLLAFEGAVVNIAGLSRTSGKNVVKCKLTADVASASVLNAGSVTNMTSSFTTQLEATGNSLLAGSAVETVTNATHSVNINGPSVTNVTQTVTMWLAQGTVGANNRYVRLTLGNSAVFTSVTNGFWSDLDLQAGTASAITNIGTGVGTSVSIVAQGTGWLVKMTGKVATTVATPSILINACSAPGTLSYTGVVTNQDFIYDHAALVNAGSISDTVFNVDTDTGWLNGDTVCVTSTSRTPLECTLYPLNANAGATSFSSALYPANEQVSFVGSAYTHSGTAPWQAEIGLITRNVKIRSTSPSLVSYFYVAAMATVTASWAEFYRMGTATASKRGIEVDCGAVTNPKSFTYCCVHDFPANGLFTAAALASYNMSYANNVHWFTGQSITINALASNGDYTFDNNLIMRAISYGFVLGDVGGTITNNTVCGITAQYGFSFNETNGVFGTFNNNLVHSSTGGMIFSNAGEAGTISNFTAWRLSAATGAINITVDNPDVVFVNPILFGNATYNIVLTTGDLTIIGGTFGGDTLFTTTNGISITGGSSRLRLDSVDMSGTGTGLAPHTGVDLLFNVSPTMSTVQTNNCKFGAPNVFLKTNWSNNAYVGFEKYNGVAGDHRCEMKYGQLRTDTVLYNTAAPSMRMTPGGVASGKLESAPDTYGIKIPVANGGSIAVAAWYKKSQTTDGALYNGTQPRLIQRANAALGQANDVVLATAADTPTVTVSGVTWDPATASKMTLSGGNLITTNTDTTFGDVGVRLPATQAQISGKYYFELKITSNVLNGNADGVGVTTPTTPLFNYINAPGFGGVFVYFNTGQIYANGSFAGASFGPGVLVAGVTIGVAIDLDNRRAWYRVSPSGQWNLSGTANPATNVGGITLGAGLMTPIMSGGDTGSNGNVRTANFGASSFVGAVPAGFTSGWSITTTAWTQISGTSSVATDDGAWEFVIDCDGNAGWISIDDWTFSGAAVTAAGMKNWYQGVPLVSSGGGGGSSGYFSGSFV